jgi:hypothetical protein
MTETKEDIQAQIDQLDAEWREGLERSPELEYGKWYVENPRRLFVLKVIAYVGVPALAFIFLKMSLSVYAYFESGQYETFSLFTYDGVVLLMVIYIFYEFPKVPKRCFKRYKSGAAHADLYAGAHSEYKSKRAELQAKLDALD